MFVRVNIRIERVFGNTEVFCDLVAGLRHEEGSRLVEKADGAHLVGLVHEGDGLADERDGLLDEFV